MFTGIIQKTGNLLSRELASESGSVQIRAKAWDRGPEIGESVALDGVCLTLTEVDVVGDIWDLSFDVLEETFQRTSLGRKELGSVLNLERSLRVGDLMGGHWVTGHVDDVGDLRTMRTVGRDRVLEIHCQPNVLDGVIDKGSITCNGMSLTVVEVGGDSFSVHVIPHTWEVTSCRTLVLGDVVNLEVDAMGKYVKKYMERL